MNPLERTTARLKGEPVDRPPNFDIFMTMAAHHIGAPLSRYYLDYRILVEANLAVLEDFNLDIVQAISDPYREAADFGAIIEFPEDDLPLMRKPLLAHHQDLNRLVPPLPPFGKRMGDRIEAIRLFRECVGGEIPIMGWVEGALAEAADLRGVMNLMIDLVQHPEWVEELLELCTQVAIDFAKAQLEAGADIIGLGDAVASLISPEMYKRFALPYEKRIFDSVRDNSGISRLHICGNTSRILAQMVHSGADIIDLDWMVDLAQANQTYGHLVAFCGNFDPVRVMLQGTPEHVYEATVSCLRASGIRGFSAAGCEIPDRTPRENLDAQFRALSEYGNVFSP